MIEPKTYSSSSEGNQNRRLSPLADWPSLEQQRVADSKATVPVNPGDLNVPQVTDGGLAVQFPPELRNIWYEEGGRYLVWHESRFIEMNEPGVRTYLKTLGVSNSGKGGPSVMDFAMTRIRLDNHVSYVGPLAGFSPGLHFINSQRILVIGQPRLITSDEAADWSLLREVIEQLLAANGGKQLAPFYSWLKIAVEALEREEYAPGQALALAGPPNCGKTLLQSIIVELLGGRSANPYSYLSGNTGFNRDLFGAEALIFGDENGSPDLRIRRTIGANTKQLTVNKEQRCHGKGREAVILTPQWRACFSLNDEPENLMVLPPIDTGIEDKLMIFRVQRPEVFDDLSKWSNNRAKDWAALKAGLPGLVAYLHRFMIPAELVDSRMGVKAYHDPDIMLALHGISPESRLMDLIDASGIFMKELVEVGPGLPLGVYDAWDGTSIQLEKALLSEVQDRGFRDSVNKLLTFSGAVGTYLGRLQKRRADRVSSKTIRGQKIWHITRDPETREDANLTTAA